MFRRWLPALALVGAALLLAPAPARAQMMGLSRGVLPFFPSQPFFPAGYPYLGNMNPLQSALPALSDFRRAQLQPLLPQQPRANSTGLTGRPHQKIEEFDPPTKAGAKPAAEADKAATAQVEVNVPAGAEVWFDGKKSTETGTVRHFETPVLQPREFTSYEVRVHWKSGGSDTDEIRHVILRAGEKRTLEMMSRPEAVTRKQ